MAGRILIADNVPTNRIILKARLMHAAYEVSVAESGSDLLGLAQSTRPDLIILSDTLRDLTDTVICQRLRTNSSTKSTPLILLSENRIQTNRFAALKAGADTVMCRLSDDNLLRARIRNLMRRRATEREIVRDGGLDSFALAEAPQAVFTAAGGIVVIAPSRSEGLSWRNQLSTRLRDSIVVLDPAQALVELSRELPPDAVVIAERADLPDEATQILSDLRCRAETLRSAVIMVQSQPNQHRAIMALDLGVSDLMVDGFNADEMALLLRRELSRKTHNDQCMAALRDGLRLAATDALTGLYNRRYALTELSNVAQNALKRNEQFAVMVLDLDRFKRINDQFGHAAGDAVLKEVTRQMNLCVRRHDFLARIGGEEFLAVIRNCDLASARYTAERLRSAVADCEITLPGNNIPVHMTMSIGLVIGGGPDAPLDPGQLIDLADRSLYASKADGRNQVTVSKTAA